MSSEPPGEPSLVARYLYSPKHLRGRHYIDLAAHFNAQGDTERALVESLEALRHVDHQARDHAFDRAVQSMASYLSVCETVKPCFATLLREIRTVRHQRASRPWALHRWLEGLVYRRRHRVDEALVALRGARRALFSLGAWRDGSRVMLDEVELYFEIGDRIDAAKVLRTVLAELEKIHAEMVVGAAGKRVEVVASNDDETVESIAKDDTGR